MSKSQTSMPGRMAAADTPFVSAEGRLATGGVPEGFADYEYLVPMRGDGFLRIETDGEPMVILHIVGLGGVTGLGGQINPAMYPLAPAITSPANGATEVGEMPTIALSGFSSPAGNAFANATYQISTSASLASRIFIGTFSAPTAANPRGSPGTRPAVTGPTRARAPPRRARAPRGGRPRRRRPGPPLR